MKQQMRQIEEELESSKKARRSQTDEFELKIKEIAAAHDKELRSVQESLEKERSQISSSAHQQREMLVANHTQVPGLSLSPSLSLSLSNISLDVYIFSFNCSLFVNKVYIKNGPVSLNTNTCK